MKDLNINELIKRLEVALKVAASGEIVLSVPPRKDDIDIVISDTIEFLKLYSSSEIAIVPIEPTYKMIRAASESECKEFEGNPTSLGDFLDFSGENMLHLVIAEAIRCAIKEGEIK